MTSEVALKIQKIKDAIWQRRPILGKIMKGHGGQSLHSYAVDFLDVNETKILDKRKHELILVAKGLISKRLGEKVADEVAQQLDHKALVSTADHHSPIQHPFWVNSNIISALPYRDASDSLLKYLVVFSFSSVSLNNASGYARGIMFHQNDNSGELIQLPILPDRNKMSIVYAVRPFDIEDLQKLELHIEKKVSEKILSAERANKVKELVEKYYKNQDVLKSDSLSEQITKINYKMWPDLFHGEIGIGGCGSSCRPPDLVYLEIETLVSELLEKYHLDNKDSLLFKFLFDKNCQKLILKYFNNIPGAFSVENDWGTYLFWAVDEKQHRVRMFLTDDKLHSAKRMHEYDFVSDQIISALKKKEIFPSMLLCYLVVSLYYGFKCLGGFCQVNDLTETKLAWQKMLTELGEIDEAQAVDPIQTRELGGDGMVLSYLRDENENIKPATGIDMVLRERNTCFEKYYDRSKQVTLDEMMGPMLPEMYTVLYTKVERDEELSALAPDQIIKNLKLDEKV